MLHEPPMPATSSPMEQRIEDTECAIQTLYEGDPKFICCKNWIETPPNRPPPAPFYNTEHDECFYRVDSSNYYGPKDQEYFEMAARSVDWNGARFGYCHQKLRVDWFSGTREIRGLVVYPASFHPAQKEAETKALARGKRFRELAGRHYMAYSGVMRYGTAETQYQRYMEGRIVVDADEYLHANPTKGVPLELLNAESTAQGLLCFITPERYNTPQGFSARPGPAAGPEAEGKDKVLTEADLLLCEPQVLGYSLQHKIWGAFNVNDIVPIAWNDTAFSSLMLPSGYKDLVLSFVEDQAGHRDVFDDVIEGKGQGIIMFLVGSPETGKTLTAEVIADQVRKPLYAMSAGELGQQAENVECRLNTVLELTEEWERQFQQNEVVAVFLRCLEYYRGIMIMTSNRADAIVRAFQSRIHLTLHYPDLGVAAKEQIWRRCMARVRCQHALTDEEFQQLALVAINGRQIKNTVRVAALLAAQRAMRLGVEQIYLVLRATRMIGA
ncbi:P-loop containing nucleoside triphosphate hydrolase protein [Aspergillus uvarum CBS 121591]|uniref:P-loop containing nucleoside triphosphate hydrolase protein n=1 Tax=Aspergillus uvarum CBS 121591 TaxID=1448315 RepID=A0A319BZH4_9EURO|nr:P-loop containing nucleoside triphosphate hydrolase protein [Aspergillus uvarum CBS 121591]PYH76899.1 P-loop containing nucleoside triphosphate hydrolase protein [Aspergillus uvarum CBS 121591]